MHNIFLYISFLSYAYPLDLNVIIEPDTIFVGTVVKITVKVENNKKDEIIIFNDLIVDLDNYTIVDKILSQNSAVYIVQFWMKVFFYFLLYLLILKSKILL